MGEEEYNELVESYGGRAVGLTFNPSGLLAVQAAKTHIAEQINEIDQTRIDATEPEVKRMCSLAITHLQEAQMWYVKALTWGSK